MLAFWVVDKSFFNIGQRMIKEAHNLFMANLFHPNGVRNAVNRVYVSFQYALMGVDEVYAQTIDLLARKKSKTQWGHKSRKSKDRHMMKMDQIRTFAPSIGKDMDFPALIRGDTLGQFVNQLFAAADQTVFGHDDGNTASLGIFYRSIGPSALTAVLPEVDFIWPSE